MSTLYLECKSGISGDMTVAALLDLGADKNVLENVLKTIPLKGFKTEIKNNSQTNQSVLNDINHITSNKLKIIKIKPFISISLFHLVIFDSQFARLLYLMYLFVFQ